MSADTGGPAFPIGTTTGPWSEAEGMTLLDWFAGQALAGILAGPSPDNPDDCYTAKDAYGLAEAMLAERKRRMGE